VVFDRKSGAPVPDVEGHVYDRANINKCLRLDPYRSPMTGGALAPGTYRLEPVRDLKTEIEELTCKAKAAFIKCLGLGGTGVLKVGDTARVTKTDGGQFGQTAVVLNTNWHGLVRVAF
jgi:hypothetical protein